MGHPPKTRARAVSTFSMRPPLGGEQRTSEFLLGLFCVIDHTLEVDDHHRLLSDYPRVVAWRNVQDVTSFRSLFGAVIHPCCHRPRDLVAEVRGLATVRLGDRLHAGRPLPAGLERGATDCGSGDLHQLDFALVKGPHLLRQIKGLQFENLSTHWDSSFWTGKSTTSVCKAPAWPRREQTWRAVGAASLHVQGLREGDFGFGAAGG